LLQNTFFKREGLLTSLNAAIVILGIGLSSCQILSVKPLDGYGLELVQLRCDSGSLAELNSSVAAKRPIACKIHWHGREDPVEVSYAGKSTIDHYKKSIDLSFQEPQVWGRKSLRLAAQTQDHSAVRSKLAHEVFEKFGFSTPKASPVSLYLNQDFLGLYWLTETIDGEFYSHRGLRVDVSYKAKYGNARFDKTTLLNLGEAFSIESGPENWEPLRRLVEIVADESLTAADRQERLSRILVINEFRDYLAASVLLNHWDGFTNNMILLWDGAAGKFRVFPWDMDRIYEENEAEFGYRSGESLWGQGLLFSRLRDVNSFREEYLARLRWGVEVFTIEHMHARSSQLGEPLSQAYEKDRYLSHEGGSLASGIKRLQEAMTLWYRGLRADL
jgi:spore coat protein CotH